MLRKFGQASLIIITAVLLLACSPLKVPEQKTYTLSQINPDTIHAARINKVLLVTTPIATPAYATNKMAYVKTPYQIQYFAENEWVDEPAHLLTPLIVKSLQQTNRFANVVASPYTGHSDYRLDVQLLQLQQNFLHNPSVIELSVKANLMDNQTQQLIASKTFDIAVNTTGDNPYSGVVAVNNAVAQLLAKLAQFVVSAPHP